MKYLEDDLYFGQLVPFQPPKLLSPKSSTVLAIGGSRSSVLKIATTANMLSGIGEDPDETVQIL